MKVSLNWLRTVRPGNSPCRPPSWPSGPTLAGLEVASVRLIGLPIPEGLRVKLAEQGLVWARDKVLVGELLKVERHPDADRLTVPTVAYGAAEPITLVTGAPNIKVGDRGQKVVLALAGATLFDGHAKEKVLTELKPGKIRGVASNGMVCSLRELGVNDEHEGIVLLDADAPVGTPLADYMGDLVLELEVTPNLARCLSMIGVAREVAALTGKTICLPPHQMQAAGEPIDGQVQVVIEDPKWSARYAAALIKNVTLGPAPSWLQRRLEYVGMRPISNIVDVTNYVMLEWGQPLHAFDYDILCRRAGGVAPTITVRPARPGEVLTTLDGVKRELTPDNLVIADTAGPIALAGVMGGQETEVSATTKNILLESANFDFLSIRRTMKAVNLISEASVRFSKGIHPELVLPALERAAELMRQFAGGTLCRGVVDNYPAPLPPQVVTLPLAEVERLLGTTFTADEALVILQALQYEVELIGPDVLRATVPPHRLDVQAGAADLIEDLARIHGYDRLPVTLLADRLPRQQTNVPLVFEERVRDLLVSMGLQEVVTYGLTMPEREAPLGQGGAYVTLVNPISSDRVVMRHTVLAGVLDVAAENLKHETDVRLFELGPVYLPRAGERLPDEPRRLALVLTGTRLAEFWGDSMNAATAKQPLDFFDLRGVLAAAQRQFLLAGRAISAIAGGLFAPRPGRGVAGGGSITGSLRRVASRKVAQTYGLANRAVLVGEMDVEALQAALPPRYGYQPVPRTGGGAFIAVVVAETLTAERVEAEIRAGGGELLRQVRLFDVYRGDSIAAGTKSLAYALTYQADDRTLAEKEIDKAHQKVEARLKHVLKATVRGKE